MAIGEIDVEQLAAVLGDGIRLIDVREVHEYEDAHVPGATLVVLGTVPERVDAFAGDGPAYVICRSGARSMQACRFLAEEGLDVVNISGGTLAWIASGRDTVSGALPG